MRAAETQVNPYRGSGRPVKTHDYDRMFDALRAKPGAWFEIEAADVPGRSVQTRRSRFYGAALRRRITDTTFLVQTVIQDGKLFARAVDEQRESAEVNITPEALAKWKVQEDA